jgi:hypothetical protein
MEKIRHKEIRIFADTPAERKILFFLVFIAIINYYLVAIFIATLLKKSKYFYIITQIKG